MPLHGVPATAHEVPPMSAAEDTATSNVLLPASGFPAWSLGCFLGPYCCWCLNCCSAVVFMMLLVCCCYLHLPAMDVILAVDGIPVIVALKSKT
jgi:hypothetical protein